VEVVNAGFPMITLKGNLARLPRDVLPLKPDLIISYHGYNGFNMIQRSLPLPFALDPPVYKARPLKLLANCEYRLRLLLAARHERALLALHPASITHPLETEYADLYGQLIDLAQTNGIRLALCTYAMAVNRNSDPDVIRFYQRRFPSVFWMIKANEVHSLIVKQLTERHPETVFVDACPGLDGDHRRFVDLMHFTPQGSGQLAETIFAAITNVLRAELAGPGTNRESAATTAP
jgi:lysophospholipase L1-like esterase